MKRRSVFAGVITCIALFITRAGTMRSQSVTKKPPEFEVASFKPSAPGNRPGNYGCHGVDSRGNALLVPLGRCVAPGQSGFQLFVLAYNLETEGLRTTERVVGDPAWFRSDLWDVEAKADYPASEADLKRMLQVLLTDRFKLKFHTDVREIPGYALIVDKNGAKLKNTSGEPRSGPMGAPPSTIPQLSTAAIFGEGTKLTAYNQPISGLVLALTGRASMGMEGPLLDETGLTGTYDFTLSWSPSMSSTLDNPGPSLSTALQEQLGLKLIKEPHVKVQFLVIDRAEKPPLP